MLKFVCNVETTFTATVQTTRSSTGLEQMPKRAWHPVYWAGTEVKKIKSSSWMEADRIKNKFIRFRMEGALYRARTDDLGLIRATRYQLR